MSWLSPPLVAHSLTRCAICSGQSHPGLCRRNRNHPGSGRRASTPTRSDHPIATGESAPSVTATPKSPHANVWYGDAPVLQSPGDRHFGAGEVWGRSLLRPGAPRRGANVLAPLVVVPFILDPGSWVLGLGSWVFLVHFPAQPQKTRNHNTDKGAVLGSAATRTVLLCPEEEDTVRGAPPRCHFWLVWRHQFRYCSISQHHTPERSRRKNPGGVFRM